MTTNTSPTAGDVASEIERHFQDWLDLKRNGGGFTMQLQQSIERNLPAILAALRAAAPVEDAEVAQTIDDLRHRNLGDFAGHMLRIAFPDPLIDKAADLITRLAHARDEAVARAEDLRKQRDTNLETAKRNHARAVDGSLALRAALRALLGDAPFDKALHLQIDDAIEGRAALKDQPT